jgi:hypothetical protein
VQIGVYGTRVYSEKPGIQEWGLSTVEYIGIDSLIHKYAEDLVRPHVAGKREKMHLRRGLPHMERVSHGGRASATLCVRAAN